jgi:DNA-binding Xre family transcriptional regulator
MISSNIKMMMKDQGITIRDLMGRTGLSNETILRARTEKIRLCRLETLATIAAALGVRTKDLYEEE